MPADRGTAIEPLGQLPAERIGSGMMLVAAVFVQLDGSSSCKLAAGSLQPLLGVQIETCVEGRSNRL